MCRHFCELKPFFSALLSFIWQMYINDLAMNRYFILYNDYTFREDTYKKKGFCHCAVNAAQYAMKKTGYFQ